MDENPTQKQRKRENKTHEITSSSLQNLIPIPNLPEEIIAEILSRLPVKSLLQFRSVSKLWLSLISSPQFIKTHVAKSIADTKLTHHRLILSSTHPHFNLNSCSVYSVFNEPSTDAIELDYPMKTPHNSVWVVGSFNGLVCLAIEEDSIFLWNPSTRKSRRLRSPEINMRFGCYIIYGFGYDECGDDFKVVGIFCVFRNGYAYETEVKVYSSKADCWRRIEDFPFGIPLDDSGKFANGALHWAASRDIRSGSPNSWIVVSLDLAKETYGEVLQPSYGEGEYDLTLGVLGEYLCILCNYGRTRTDVWIMKEYGVRESWTKLVTIPYLKETMTYSKPLGISENGDILLEFESHLILYNANDSIFKDPEIHKFDGCLEADTYVESLVSPNF